MDFERVKNEVLKVTQISREFCGNSTYCIIGIITLGKNVKLEEYYFNMFDKLEKSLESKYYMSSGASDGIVNMDFYRKYPNIGNSKNEAALDFLRTNKTTVAEARLMCTNENEKAMLIGLQDEMAFNKIANNFMNATRMSAENTLLIDFVKKKLIEISELNISDSDIEQINKWQRQLEILTTFCQLEILPWDYNNKLADIHGIVDKKKYSQFSKGIQNLRRKYSLPLIDNDFFIEFRERYLPSILFYKLTVQNVALISKNIINNLRKFNIEIAFVLIPGFTWYLLYQYLEDVGCSYIMVETPSLASLGATVENSNLDHELIDFLTGKTLGANTAESIIDINDEYPESPKKHYCLFKRGENNEFDISVATQFNVKKVNKVKQSHKLLEIAEKQLSDEKFQTCLKKAKQCSDIFYELGDTWCLANGLVVMGNAYLQLNDLTKALDFLNQAQQYYNSLGDIENESKVLYSLGMISKRIGNYNEASKFLSSSIRLFTILDQQSSLANSYLWRAFVLYAQEKNKEAKSDLLVAKDIFNKENNIENILIINKVLINISSKLNETVGILRYRLENAKLDPKSKEQFINEVQNELAKKGEDIDIQTITETIDTLIKFFNI